MKHTIVATALTGVALFTAGQAMAAQAYMDGLLNVGPGWSTITMPDGSTCAAGCTEVKYDYFTQGSATRAAGAWMDANDNPDAVLYTYSLGSIGAVSALATRPDWQGKIIALGSPARDTTNSAANGGRPWSEHGDVTFVSVKGDSVAYPGGSFFTHMWNYRNRNFATETPVAVNNPTEAVEDREYATTAPRPAPSTATPVTKVRFNLFDMRTWFKPASHYETAADRAAATEAASSPTAARTAVTEANDTEVAADRPTAAERRAERKAANAAKREERREAKAAQRAERRAAKVAQVSERQEAAEADTADASDQGDDTGTDGTE